MHLHVKFCQITQNWSDPKVGAASANFRKSNFACVWIFLRNFLDPLKIYDGFVERGFQIGEIL